MTCPDCGSDQLSVAVPDDLRGLLPDDPEAVAICTHCLTLEPSADADATDAAESPDFTRISDDFPTGDAGVAMALALGLLDSLALYRSELSDLLERVERGGTDPLLALDRLAGDRSLEPHFDLERRRPQVEQLLYE